VGGIKLGKTFFGNKKKRIEKIEADGNRKRNRDWINKMEERYEDEVKDIPPRQTLTDCLTQTNLAKQM
jgi:hypothetical protein